MADLNRIKNNVRKMVDQSAPEHDIDTYLASEGVTPDQVKAHRLSSPQSPQPPSAFTDIMRDIPSIPGKIAAGVIGLPGDIEALSRRGVQYLAEKVLPEPLAKVARAGIGAPTGHPGAQTVGDDISAPFGGFYQPQTTPGRYADTIMQMLPAAAIPGSIPMRLARVAIPGATSETAGQVAEAAGLSPGWQTAARIAGAGVGGFAARPTVRSINALTAPAGFPIENPGIAARQTLGDAVRRDGGPTVVNSHMDSWRGNSNPALIDVTGNNVRRLVRAAASGGDGEAQNAALSYADRVAGNLQDNALQVTRRLTPDARTSATQYVRELEAAQQADARTNYAGPYRAPAAITDEMVDALRGPEGQRAINAAWADASANRDAQGIKELGELKGVAASQEAGVNPQTGKPRLFRDVLSDLSAGSLDRVRIAMRDIGRGYAAKGMWSRSGGYRDRVRDIDTALDQTPGLQDARASFKDFAAQQDAVEHGGTGFSASPEDYAATIAELARRGTPNLVRRAAGVGMRQSLTDAISRPQEGATGVLNRISTSDATRRNLGATYGERTAADYQTGIGNEKSRIDNARFISPNNGSQTMLRAMDTGLVDIINPHVGILTRVLDAVRRGGKLTDAERTEIVRLGTTEARLVELGRANPRLTSQVLAESLLASGGGEPRGR